VILITDFRPPDEDDSVMRKRRQSDMKKKNLPAVNRVRTIVMNDVELFDSIFNQLDELRQWCEDMESRLWWMEEALRFFQSNSRAKVPLWYESWLNKKVNA
jgi:hypothetical protein